MCKKLLCLFCLVLIPSLVGSGKCAGEIILEELFDDGNFSSRGWYDNTNLQLSTTEHIPGSISSVQYHFRRGQRKPISGGAIRRQFPGTESVYLSFYIKHSANWTGSNRSYHPHEFHFMTNNESKWAGPAYTHLTLYIETNEGVPKLGIQDGKNIDEDNIGVDLTNVTEERAVAGCNGNSDSTGRDNCYGAGSHYANGKQWGASAVYFQDSPGPKYKNDWHFVEAYFQLNSIVDGKAIADGQVKYWFDGELIINYENVLLRTGQHPDMKFNQFLIAPYIGPGSPIAQTFWVDNLKVAAARPLVGDFYSDGRIDFKDFAQFAGVWLSKVGQAKWTLEYEISQPPDGIIGVFDLGQFVENWLSTDE